MRLAWHGVVVTIGVPIPIRSVIIIGRHTQHVFSNVQLNSAAFYILFQMPGWLFWVYALSFESETTDADLFIIQSIHMWGNPNRPSFRFTITIALRFRSL